MDRLRPPQQRRGAVVIKDGVPYGNPATTLSLMPAAAQGEWLQRNAHFVRGRLLDLGCGNQPYRAWYTPLVDEAVACDVEALPGVDVVSPAEELPFPDASFDCVLACEVLEHVDDVEAVWAEAARVLRPGGYLLLTVPFIYPIHEAPHDHLRFTNFGIESALARHGFAMVGIDAKGGLGVLAGHWLMLTAATGSAVLSQRLGLRRPIQERRWFRAAISALQGPVVRRGVACEVRGSARWATLGYMAVARRRD